MNSDVDKAIATESAEQAPANERADDVFLRTLGENVRAMRADLGMTRKMLASASGVSERFLAQLESGTGNASVLVLRQIAKALETSVERLIAERESPSAASPTPSSSTIENVLRMVTRLSPADVARVRQVIIQEPGALANKRRSERVALIGLRGAGKSTIGAQLAQELGLPFLELDRLVEQTSGLSLNALFDLYGQSAFRRFERQCLEQVLKSHPRFVLATGGGIVSAPETFERLLESCYTIWLKATPREHMDRVIAQGDMRPMAKNPAAMTDLERILREREPLYSQADLTVNTIDTSVDKITRSLAEKLTPLPK
jgi:XRE family transcriptional regulator, aerobic/anaerobic benzoate catabolism transcriptional regulator